MTDEQNRLVENNLGLVRAALGKIHYGKDKSEFLSIGYEALCTAATVYDPSKGRFSSFAYSCIHNAYLVEIKRRKRWNNRLVDIFERENQMEDGWTWEDKISAEKETFEEKYLDHVTAQEILEIVNKKLMEDEQELLLTVIKCGNSYDLTAKKLGISRQSVYDRMKRIKGIVLWYYKNGIN